MVDFPVPPLPDVTAITFDIISDSFPLFAGIHWLYSLQQRRQPDSNLSVHSISYYIIPYITELSKPLFRKIEKLYSYIVSTDRLCTICTIKSDDGIIRL